MSVAQVDIGVWRQWCRGIQECDLVVWAESMGDDISGETCG